MIGLHGIPLTRYQQGGPFRAARQGIPASASGVRPAPAHPMFPPPPPSTAEGTPTGPKVKHQVGADAAQREDRRRQARGIEVRRDAGGPCKVSQADGHGVAVEVLSLGRQEPSAVADEAESDIRHLAEGRSPRRIGSECCSGGKVSRATSLLAAKGKNKRVPRAILGGVCLMSQIPKCVRRQALSGADALKLQTYPPKTIDAEVRPSRIPDHRRPPGSAARSFLHEWAHTPVLEQHLA